MMFLTVSCGLSAAVLAFAALWSAIYANDEANDARYLRRRFAGWCSGAVALAALAASQVAIAAR